jgi:hypothetical protein
MNDDDPKQRAEREYRVGDEHDGFGAGHAAALSELRCGFGPRLSN